MEAGQRVKWNENGDLGTVEWVTNRGSFGITWDNGQFVEYSSCSDHLVTIIETSSKEN